MARQRTADDRHVAAPRPAPAAPPAPTPLWRRIADQAARAVGIDDELASLAAAAKSASDWLDAHNPVPPEVRARVQARFAELDAQGARDRADRQRQWDQTWERTVAGPARQVWQSDPMQGIRQDLRALWTPTPSVQATGDLLKQGIESRGQATRDAVSLSGPLGQAAHLARYAVNEAIPNFAIDAATDTTTPLGAASNLDLPVGKAAGLAGKAAHWAGLLPPGLLGSVDDAARAATGGIRAYHGSPHSFAPEPGFPLGRFRADKIGSGQGAASYGYGHYLAEAEPVALDYRRSLGAARDTEMPGGGRLPNWVAEHARAEQAGNPSPSFTIDALIRDFKARIGEAEERVASQAPQYWNDEAKIPGLQRVVQGLEEAKAGVPVPEAGHMYEARIDVDPADLLDWDAPIGRQTQVRERLGDEGLLPAQYSRQASGVPQTGEGVYHGLATRYRRPGQSSNPEKASRVLQEAGIPGLRYLDQHSRGGTPAEVAAMQRRLTQLQEDKALYDRLAAVDQVPPLGNQGQRLQEDIDRLTARLVQSENPTRNLVMFPGSESRIDILRKYGLLPPLAVGGAAVGAAGDEDGEEGSSNVVPFMAGVLPITLGRQRPVGDLAKTLRYLGDGRYALRPGILRRLAEVYGVGQNLERKATWGGSTHPEMLDAFGGDPELGRRWARFFGSTSAGTSVPKNTQESIATQAFALEHPGQPFVPDSIYTSASGVQVPSLSLYDTVITNAGSKLNSLNANLAGLDPTGPKTEAMGQFMYGLRRSPIDRHVLWALGSADDTLAAQNKNLKAFMLEQEGLRPHQMNERGIYQRYENALAHGLQGLDLGRPYNPLFGDFWEGVRAMKGEKYQGGPIDILRAKDLLGPGYLTDPDRLKFVLGQSGDAQWVAK